MPGGWLWRPPNFVDRVPSTPPTPPSSFPLSFDAHCPPLPAHTAPALLVWPQDGRRFGIFKRTLRNIIADNTNEQLTYASGLNEFSALTAEEFTTWFSREQPPQGGNTSGAPRGMAVAKASYGTSGDWSYSGRACCVLLLLLCAGLLPPLLLLCAGLCAARRGRCSPACSTASSPCSWPAWVALGVHSS